MKRCFDETGPSEAGGDNFNSCADVVQAVSDLQHQVVTSKRGIL